MINKKRGCLFYLLGSIIVTSIGGFLSSQGENLSDIEYAAAMLVGLLVGGFSAKILFESLKKKINPYLVDAAFCFFIAMSVFGAFYMLVTR